MRKFLKMYQVPAIASKQVTTLRQILQVRRLRNSSYDFMTNYRKPIGIIQQICWYFRYYQAARRSGNYRVYLFYERQNTPVGYGALHFKNAQLYITECIMPVYRGRGYGSTILAKLIEIAQKENRNLVAEILANNTRSIAMHENSGFQFIQNSTNNGKIINTYTLTCSQRGETKNAKS